MTKAKKVLEGVAGVDEAVKELPYHVTMKIQDENGVFVVYVKSGGGSEWASKEDFKDQKAALKFYNEKLALLVKADMEKI